MPHSKSVAYLSATQWLYDRIDYESLARPGIRYRFTLERMRELMVRLGHAPLLTGHQAASASANSQPASANSQPALAKSQPALAKSQSGTARPRIIHIAGTKGKGSVANMIATMLTAAGYRVGLYTSPHLVNLEERFRVDGCPAAETQMVELIDSLRPVVRSMSAAEIGGPSFFELTTAMAIEHFHRSGCDFWVLETGLGGRLDSTNVFQSDVAILTSIGLDHQHVLGDTIELISKEKAGILKPGVPAVSGVVRPSARDVIRQVAAQVHAPLLELGRDFFVEPAPECAAQPALAALRNSDRDPWGSSFELLLRRPKNQVEENSNAHTSRIAVSLSLQGQHQVNNAATAIMALDQLGIPICEPSLAALAGLQIEARLERFRLPTGTTVILDAAHNPDSIAALVQTLATRFHDRTVVGVFGTSVDKDAATMLDCLRHSLAHLILTRYHGNPRYVPVDALLELARSESPQDWSSVNECPTEACAAAITKAGRDGVVVICGSFFLAAEIRPWLVEQASPAVGVS